MNNIFGTNINKRSILTNIVLYNVFLGQKYINYNNNYYNNAINESRQKVSQNQKINAILNSIITKMRQYSKRMINLD